MPQFFDRRNQSDKRMRRESQDAQNKNDAFENSGEVTKGRPNYLIGGTSRFSSNDKQLVSLHKRQSAVLKDSMPISRASDSKVVPLHEQDDVARAQERLDPLAEFWVHGHGLSVPEPGQTASVGFFRGFCL